MIRKATRIAAVFAVLLTAGFGVPVTACWAIHQDVTIVSNDEYQLTLELRLPPFHIENVERADGIYQRIHVPGWAGTSGIGLPDLPHTGALIQVPQTGEISLEVLEDSYELMPNCRVLPAFPHGISDSSGMQKEVAENDAAMHSIGLFPQASAEISPRSTARGVPVVRVSMHPFRWNPATGELRYSRKIVARVRFSDPISRDAVIPPVASAGAVEAAADLYTNMLKSMVLNYRNPAKEGNEPPENQASSAPAQVQGVRIEIKHDGIYRISYDSLATAGATLSSISPSTFKLFNSGKEVAIKIVTAKIDRFLPGDYIELYGQAIRDAFTDTNVYWLYWGGSKGKRVGTVDGRVTGKGKKVSSFVERLHFEENHTIWEGMPEAPEKDYWFWQQLAAPTSGSYTINIPTPDPYGTTRLRVCFRGRTTDSHHPNHHTRISWNNTQVGDSHWDGNVEYIQAMNIPGAMLIAGNNTVKIATPGDTGAIVDVVYLNWMELSYRRRLSAVENGLKFTIRETGKLECKISELSEKNVVIYDISNPSNIREIVNPSVTLVGKQYLAAFEDTILQGDRTYCIQAVKQIKQPESLSFWTTARLESTNNAADFILITSKELLPSMEPLLQLRKSLGLRVKAVAVEDIYNEFNYGLFNPSAIKRFLQYAYSKWVRPAPMYVLLFGDSNTDYRDYLGAHKKNVVPVHLSISLGLGITPNDNWYACVDGNDVLPDIFVGRISGNNIQQVAGIVDKIVRFEYLEGYRPDSAQLVADNDDLYFETLNDHLAGLLPAQIQARKVYLRSYTSAGQASQDIITNMNSGALLTNYIGHGSVTYWAGERLFQSSNVAALSTDKLTLVVSLSCLNGYFSHPIYYSLADAFVLAPSGGAIGSFALSSLGYQFEYEMVGNELFSRLFENNNFVLGSLVTGAKIGAYARGAPTEFMNSATFFGDPAARLKDWR